jgi:cadmium resistance transport/sequestration family protein
MNQTITTISTAITSFAATNVDDLVVLTLFFSQVNATFRSRHIVLGQYLGFAALILASLPGFFGGLMVPQPLIGILGLVPIAIGISQFLSDDADDSVDDFQGWQSKSSPIRGWLSPQTCGVAAVTFANGGDNVGIYMPLFASNSFAELVLTLVVFFSLVGVWCLAAHSLTKQPAIAHTLTRYGNSLVPYILVGLGIFIFWDSLLLALLSIAAIYFCMRSIAQIKTRAPEIKVS